MEAIQTKLTSLLEIELSILKAEELSKMTVFTNFHLQLSYPEIIWCKN